MALTNERIKERITEKFGEQITEWEESYGMLSFRVPATKNLEIVQFLYQDEELGFRFLTDLTGNHFPERKDEELCVVCHLHNMVANARIRVRAYVPVAQPDIHSLTPVFSGANWMERETYDFFGINFVGHPNLTRILNVDDMDYFPMRKEYAMEDPTRVDKDDEMFGRGGTVV
ncbi:MAG: NADH-quinone oxidoreductase subunit C [Sphingobacteriales bacterium]|nr:MAG: NADH-quinone oxidoreductase subunit C [Sphingobacteriales bacterium]